MSGVVFVAVAVYVPLVSAFIVMCSVVVSPGFSVLMFHVSVCVFGLYGAFWSLFW